MRWHRRGESTGIGRISSPRVRSPVSNTKSMRSQRTSADAASSAHCAYMRCSSNLANPGPHVERPELTTLLSLRVTELSAAAVSSYVSVEWCCVVGSCGLLGHQYNARARFVVGEVGKTKTR